MASKYSFNDKTLAEEFETSASRFENFQKMLDATTADAKTLEGFFKECGFCIPHFVQVADDIRLGWDRHGDAWRLVAGYVIGYDPSGEEECSLRPFLETNAKLRVMCKPYLPQLLRELHAYIPAEEPDVQDPPQTEGSADDLDMIFANEDEIPF